MTDNKRVTMADVARKAGVSKMTVSRVLNNKGEISEATHQRVMQAIEELQYIPHAQAQRLGRGTSRTIGLLYPLAYLGNQPINLLEMDFMIGAATAAGEANYFFNLIAQNVDQELLLSMYRGAQLDGVILVRIHLQDWRVDLLRDHNYPFVMIGRCEDNSGLDLVDLQFEIVLPAAFEYLIGLGHHKIGFLNYPRELRESGYGPAVRARQGFEQIVEEHNLPRYLREVDFGVENIYAATCDLLDEAPDLTALITPHDVAVFGVLRALQQMGRRVPEDVSVIGLATDKVAELVSPALTTMRFRPYEMGYQAAKMLIRKLKGEAGQPRHVLFGPDLAVRNSTGRARGISRTSESVLKR